MIVNIMTQDNITETSLTGETHVDSSDGSAAVDTSLSLAALNSLLGKNFTDVPAAQKALKDTFAYVGKRKEDIEAEIRASGTAAAQAASSTNADAMKEIQAVKERLFYSENPQYKGYESLIAKMGTNPAEVTASPEFTSIFEKVQKADEVNSRQTIAPSNARLAQTKSTTDEAVVVANARGATQEDVATVLARGIISEMDGQS